MPTYATLLDAATTLATNSSLALYNQIRTSAGLPAVKDPDPNYPITWADYAASLCDLNAYIIMCMAIGVDRVEAMKAAVNGFSHQSQEGEWETGDGIDNAYLIKQGEGEHFMTTMDAWCKLAGSGVVQLKFKFNESAHTFAIERFESDDETRFRVYQGYEWLYRLNDHMGLANDTCNFVYGANSTAVDPTATGTLWANTAQYNQLGRLTAGTTAYVNLLAQHINSIRADYTNFLQMRRLNGNSMSLDWAALSANVIDPLMSLMAGNLKTSDYSLLAGSPTHGFDRSRRGTPWLILMMSNYIYTTDSVSFANLQINPNLAKMTMFVELP